MVEIAGIEPATSELAPGALPLSHTPCPAVADRPRHTDGGRAAPHRRQVKADRWGSTLERSGRTLGQDPADGKARVRMPQPGTASPAQNAAAPGCGAMGVPGGAVAIPSYDSAPVTSHAWSAGIPWAA